MTLTPKRKARIEKLAAAAVEAYGDMTVELQTRILMDAAADDIAEGESQTFGEVMEYLNFIVSLRAETSYNPQREVRK